MANFYTIEEGEDINLFVDRALFGLRLKNHLFPGCYHDAYLAFFSEEVYITINSNALSVKNRLQEIWKERSAIYNTFPGHREHTVELAVPASFQPIDAFNRAAYQARAFCHELSLDDSEDWLEVNYKLDYNGFTFIFNPMSDTAVAEMHQAYVFHLNTKDLMENENYETIKAQTIAMVPEFDKAWKEQNLLALSTDQYDEKREKILLLVLDAATISQYVKQSEEVLNFAKVLYTTLDMEETQSICENFVAATATPYQAYIFGVTNFVSSISNVGVVAPEIVTVLERCLARQKGEPWFPDTVSVN